MPRQRGISERDQHQDRHDDACPDLQDRSRLFLGPEAPPLNCHRAHRRRFLLYFAEIAVRRFRHLLRIELIIPVAVTLQRELRREHIADQEEYAGDKGEPEPGPRHFRAVCQINIRGIFRCFRNTVIPFVIEAVETDPAVLELLRIYSEAFHIGTQICFSGSRHYSVRLRVHFQDHPVFRLYTAVDLLLGLFYNVFLPFIRRRFQGRQRDQHGAEMLRVFLILSGQVTACPDKCPRLPRYKVFPGLLSDGPDASQKPSEFGKRVPRIRRQVEAGIRSAARDLRSVLIEYYDIVR